MFELDQRAMAIDGFHPGPLIYRALAESLSERITYIAKRRLFCVSNQQTYQQMFLQKIQVKHRPY